MSKLVKFSKIFYPVLRARKSRLPLSDAPLTRLFERRVWGCFDSVRNIWISHGFFEHVADTYA